MKVTHFSPREINIWVAWTYIICSIKHCFIVHNSIYKHIKSLLFKLSFAGVTVSIKIAISHFTLFVNNYKTQTCLHNNTFYVYISLVFFFIFIIQILVNPSKCTGKLFCARKIRKKICSKLYIHVDPYSFSLYNLKLERKKTPNPIHIVYAIQ